MRVLILHNRYREPGGEDSVVRTETELLRQGGQEVVLHEVSNPDGAVATMAGLAFSTWSLRSEREVAALLTRAAFDVAHIHNTWFQLTPSVLKPLSNAGIPIVMTVHNYRFLCLAASFHRDGHRCTDCLGKIPWRGIIHRCYRESVVQSTVLATAESAHRLMRTWTRYVDLFITPSQFARQLLIDGGLPSNRVVVKPHHIPDPGPRTSPPSASRQVVYAGRLSADKGVRTLTEAWMAADTGLELILAGDGAMRAELEQPARRSIRLAGWLSRAQLMGLMKQARALALPTTMFETFGLSAVEAMAAGLPVITTGGGAIAEAVGECGPPAPAPQAGTAGWSAAIRALTDPKAVDRWGESGRRRYLDSYAPERGLTRVLDVYDRAMAINSTGRHSVE